MAKRARVWTGTQWDDVAVQLPDLSNYSTTSQMNTAITNNVGLVPILTQTIGTTVSSIVVNNVFSATYDNYKVIISGGVGSTSDQLQIRLGAVTSGYKYSFGYQNFSGTAYNGLNSTSTDGVYYVGAYNTNTINADIDIRNPFLTKDKFIVGQTVTENFGGTSRGYLASTTSMTSFTIFPQSGTLTGGTIYVYGYKK
jgi:hypothetical protein